MADTVTVYFDPLTRDVREGEAEVLEVLDHYQDDALIPCAVRFAGDVLDVCRMVDREALADLNLLPPTDAERLIDQVDAMIDEAKYDGI